MIKNREEKKKGAVSGIARNELTELGLERRDGRLTEVVVVEFAHRQSDIALRETKLDASSLECFRKNLQFLKIVYLVGLQ